MQLQCIAAFGGLQVKQQQMKVVLLLDGENVVGSRMTKLLSQHFRCTALGI